MAHIRTQIERLPFSAPHVVELGAGPGHLAELLLTALAQLTYTGLDNSELLLNYARERLIPYNGRAHLIQTDLNADDWPKLLPGPVHAIFSMQSLHDLGGEAQVNRIYVLARSLLAPGGLFLNADLVVPPGRDKPDNPGRRSIPRHLELLRSHAYERVSCTLERGEFGCVVGFAPGVAQALKHE
jgi:SAM-dependent methyltransferase